MIVAKTVVPNQFWILRDQDRKIGNIQAEDQGYMMRINDNVMHFQTLDMLQQRVAIDFENSENAKKTSKYSVHGYPTSAHSFNGVWDVKRQIPLWTTEERSKSWMAAGWYRVKQHRDWQLVFCPKLIVLDRYQYQGPFYTNTEAEKHEPAHQ